MFVCVWGKSNIWHCIKYTKWRIYLAAERTHNHITSVHSVAARAAFKMVQNERRSRQIRFGLFCVFMQNCNPHTDTCTAYTHALQVGEHCLMPKPNKTRATDVKGLKAGRAASRGGLSGGGYVERANVRLCVAKFRIYIFISRIAAANMRHMAIDAISQVPKKDEDQEKEMKKLAEACSV